MTGLRRILACCALLAAAPLAAQDYDPCHHLDDETSFCGKPMGWQLADVAPMPGTLHLENRDFALTLTHQKAHGRAVTSALFADMIDAILLQIDASLDAPPGLHRAEFVEDIRYDLIEGRRFAVTTDRIDPPTSLMVDIYISPRHLWIVQTGHRGPIALDRLAKAHAYAIEEMRFAD